MMLGSRILYVSVKHGTWVMDGFFRYEYIDQLFLFIFHQSSPVSSWAMTACLLSKTCSEHSYILPAQCLA